VTDDFPIENDVFYLRASPNIVNDQIVVGLRVFSIDNNSDVKDPATEIPRDNISRRIILGPTGNRQGLSPAAEEDHQIRNAAVVDIRVGARVKRIGVRTLHDVLVNFFLQIDSERTVRTDHLVGAHAGVRWNIAARIRNSHICGIVPYAVMRSFDRGCREVLQNSLMTRALCLCGRRSCPCQTQEQHKAARIPALSVSSSHDHSILTPKVAEGAAGVGPGKRPNRKSEFDRSQFWGCFRLCRPFVNAAARLRQYLALKRLVSATL
jgi:hypothetical protein